MSDSILDKTKEICASLWYAPATLEGLSERLKINEYLLSKLLAGARRKNWIYERGESFYCYKKTVREVLNPAGYDIDLSKPYESEFRKAFRLSNFS